MVVYEVPVVGGSYVGRAQRGPTDGLPVPRTQVVRPSGYVAHHAHRSERAVAWRERMIWLDEAALQIGTVLVVLAGAAVSLLPIWV